MSGVRDDRRGRPPARPLLPLLDRLIDEEPEQAHDRLLSAGETMSQLRRSVRREIEALLNARRRWRSWPRHLRGLAISPLNFGIPDCTGGAFHDIDERETLRREIEDTIRRFEPRFQAVQVSLMQGEDKLESTLRLRIEARLLAGAAWEPIAFDTLIDAATQDVQVRNQSDV